MTRGSRTSQSSSPGQQGSPTPGSTKQGQHQRLSCLECQRRKSKCDKQVPCNTCTQRGIVCHPAVVDPNKPRKKRFPERELLDRIRKYEGLLSSAGIDKDQEVPEPHGSSYTAVSPLRKRFRRASNDSTASFASDHRDPPTSSLAAAQGRSLTPPRTTTIDPDIGHLESILETVPPLKDHPFPSSRRSEHILHPSYAASSGAGTSSAVSNGSTSTKPYQYSTAADHAVSSALVIHKHLDVMFPDDGSKYFNFDDHCPGEPLQHPDTSLMFRLLHLYQQHIHPLIKVIHMPTVRERLCDITADPESATSHDHALFFAIFTIVISTLTADEAERLFHTRDKKLVAEQYRRNAQTALYRVDVWRSSNLTALQAYVLYLLTMTRDVDPRTYVIYSGIAVRMAQRLMPLHDRRSSASFSAASNSVVGKEMAIRVWWEIQACDMRACEKAGIPCNPTLATATTRLPSNANDNDLEQLAPAAAPSNMPTLADARLSMPDTECLFLFLRCELAQFQLHPPWSRQHPEHYLQQHLFRSTSFLRRHLESRQHQSSSSLAWRLAAVDAFESYIHKRYFDRFETASNTLVQFAHHHARIWIEKLRLLVHLNQRSPENDAEIIKICTTQVGETAKLIANPLYVRYQWFTYAHLPFFSFVVLLDLLRQHTTGQLADKAWVAIEASSVIWRPDLHSKKGNERGSEASGIPATGPTSNIHADPKSQDDQAKLQIRGTMLAALLVAAWEKRSQALMEASGCAPPEPPIVTAMGAVAVVHHLGPVFRNPSSRPSAAQPPPPPLHMQSDDAQPDQQHAQGNGSYLAGRHALGEQAAGSGLDDTPLTAFLDPSMGTSGSALDDMLNLNSLLQSSVDLDWSAWFGQSWDPTPGALGDLASPVHLLPSD